MLAPERKKVQNASKPPVPVFIHKNHKRLRRQTVAVTLLLLGSLSVSLSTAVRAADAAEAAPRWGYIAPSGDYAIRPRFLEAGEFREGLAAVKLKVRSEAKAGSSEESSNPQDEEQSLQHTDENAGEEKWGFIEKSGKLVIEAQYEDVLAFSEGLAAVRRGKWGFIDRSGKFVIEPQFDDVSSFSEGLAPASHSSLAWGFIDRTGTWKIEPKFQTACRFSDSRAAVMTGDGFGSYQFKVSDDRYEVRGAHWSYIDKSGQRVIDSEFEAAGLFSQNVAPVALGFKQGINRPDRWGFLNTEGKLLIKPQFQDVHAPPEDVAAVQFGSWQNIGKGYRSWKPGKWGYIKLSGKTLIPPQFDAADRFSEGLASVLSSGKWGYIDKTGKLVIAPRFKYTGEFHEHLAPVCPSQNSLENADRSPG